MIDPFIDYPRGFLSPATQMVAIAPDDANDVAVGTKALRVWNPGTGVAVVRVLLMDDATPVNLSFPAGSLTVEDIRVQRVYTTGTTPGVILHGYTEPGAVIPGE